MMKKGLRTAALSLVLTLTLTACGPSSEPTTAESQDTAVVSEQGTDTNTAQTLDWEQMQPTGQMELSYAQQFSVDYYEDDFSLVTIEKDRYLVVPEGKTAPQNLDEDITVLQQPLDKTYLVATSAMDFVRAIDSIDNIRLSGSKESSWYIDEAKEAMQKGELLYAGKYSAPDYELILSEGCNLAVESSMIYHTPEVKEQLEKLGIPVLVEHSSYESHPLGRMEWIKLYGLLFQKENEAKELFDSETAKIKDVINQPKTDKTVSFFYINSKGMANVRKPNDYISKIIELAGGTYIFSELPAPDNALSTFNMQMEDFYAGAKDADYIIYNSSIDAELTSLDELLEKSSLFSDFKAVKDGNVWCTGKNMFQESMGISGLILDIHDILTAEQELPEQLNYLHRLR